MTKFLIDVSLDGYETEEEHDLHCNADFVEDSLRDAGAFCSFAQRIEIDDLDKVFNEITKIISHPHKTITEHDRVRAAKVLEMFESFLQSKEFIANELNRDEKKRFSEFSV